jgi:hypothetical protein
VSLTFSFSAQRTRLSAKVMLRGSADAAARTTTTDRRACAKLGKERSPVLVIIMAVAAACCYGNNERVYQYFQVVTEGRHLIELGSKCQLYLNEDLAWNQWRL